MRRPDRTVNMTRRFKVRRAIAPEVGRLRLRRREGQDAKETDNADRRQPGNFLGGHFHNPRVVVNAARHAQLQDEWLETLIGYPGIVSELLIYAHFAQQDPGLPFATPCLISSLRKRPVLAAEYTPNEGLRIWL